MPSRLLEISDDHGDLKLRLRDRSELQSGRYCTLSHRWGGPGTQTYQLTTASLNSFRNGTSTSILRPTFRDMADLTWRLGVRLMWIDCMCIIQDDTQDWKDESALMGKVYANSWLNVSANAMDAGRSGLYAERYVLNHLAHFRTRYDETGEAMTWTVTAANVWWDEVEAAPVNLRAWVIQERILSPRIVHMSSRLALWECRQFQASEYFPHGPPPFQKSRNNHSKLKQLYCGNQFDDLAIVLENWNLLLERYTRCGLTVETDKLIALSGIASEVCKRMQCDYLAGIWSMALPLGLLWYSCAPDHARPKNYVAPSWSWASTRYIDSPPSNEGTSWTYAIIIRYATSLANPSDKFGQVTDGSIEMKANLGTLNWVGAYDDYNNFDVKEVEIFVPEDSGGTKKISHLSPPPSPTYTLFFDVEAYRELQTAYFAVIRSELDARQFRDGIWSCGYNLQGLLLKRLPCSRYERIGVALLKFPTEQDFVDKMPVQDITII